MAQPKLKVCVVCQQPFKGRPNAKTCSVKCRKRLSRARSLLAHEAYEVKSAGEHLKHIAKEVVKDIETGITPFATEEGFVSSTATPVQAPSPAAPSPPFQPANATVTPVSQPPEPLSLESPAPTGFPQGPGFSPVLPTHAPGTVFAPTAYAQPQPAPRAEFQAQQAVSPSATSPQPAGTIPDGPILPPSSPPPTQRGPRFSMPKLPIAAKLAATLITIISMIGIGTYLLGNQQAQQKNHVTSNPTTVSSQGTFSNISPATGLTLNVDTLFNKQIKAVGEVIIQNAVDSTSAFSIQNAKGSALLVADTTDSKIAIGQPVEANGSTLQVAGDISATGAVSAKGTVLTSGGISANGGTTSLSNTGLTINSVLVCTATGCSATTLGGHPASFYTNAANLVGGTLSDAVLPSNVALLDANQTFTNINSFTNGLNTFVGDGSGLSALNASHITAGTIADTYLSSNVALKNGNNVFSGTNTFNGQSNFNGMTIQNGNFLFQSATNSVGAFQIQNAAGNDNLLVADTINTRIGIGTATPNYTLDVNGDVNVAAGHTFRINGTDVCSGGLCNPSSGSSYYINNTTSTQASANFNIQSVGATSVGGIIKGATGQTADLFEGQNGSGTIVYALDPQGNVNITGQYKINGATLCSAGGCTAASGSGSYIQNGISLQANANFNIESANAANVGGIIRGISGQTADLFEAKDGNGIVVNSIGANGAFLAKDTQSGGNHSFFAIQGSNFANSLLAADTVTGQILLPNANLSSTALLFAGNANLYAPSNNNLKTDNNLTVAGNLTVNGAGLFQNATNSTTAFQVQNATGTQVFNVDTTNGRVGIGTASPGSTLDVATGGILVGSTTPISTGSGTYSNIDIGSALNNTSYINLNVATGTNNAQLRFYRNSVYQGGVAMLNSSNDVYISSDGGTAAADFNNGGISVGGYANVNNAPAGGIIVPGSVGIGDTNPQQALSIADGGPEVYIGKVCGNSTSFSGIAFGNNGTGDCGHYSLLSDGTNTHLNAPSGVIYLKIGNTTTVGEIASNGLSLGAGAVSPFAALSLPDGSGSQLGGIRFGGTGDTNLYRSAASTLQTDSSFTVGGSLLQSAGGITFTSGAGALIQRSASTTGITTIALRASADTYDRLDVTAGGQIQWGPGNATQDTNLYRSAAGELQTTGKIDVENGLQLGGSQQLQLGAADANTVSVTAGTGSSGVKSLTVGGSLSTGYGGGSASWTQLGLVGPSSQAGLLLGNDTNLYRSAANTLKTDSNLYVGPVFAAYADNTINQGASIGKTFNIATSNVEGLDVNINNGGTGQNTGINVLTNSAAGSGARGDLLGINIGIRELGATTTTTNGYGIKIVSPDASAGGTINNAYGIDIQSQKSTGVTNAYGIYQEGINDVNYLAGQIQADSGNLKIGGFTQVNGSTPYLADSSGELILGTGTAAQVRGVFTNPDTGTPAIRIQQVASGVANLLQLQNSSGNILTQFNSNGDLSIGGTNSAASATALQILNPSGTKVLAADTVNNQVNVTNLQSSGTISLQGPDGGSILLRTAANSGTGSNAMTFSGNEITDKTRAANTQGDGRQPPDSSTGIWESTTNLVTNGGFETNTTGWGANAAGTTLSRDTSEAKFGSASLKSVTSGSVTDQGSQFTVTGLSSSTTYTGSVWAWGSGTVHFGLSDGVTQTFGSAITLSSTPQRITLSKATASSSTQIIFTVTTNSAQAVTFWIDGAQLEQKSIATPYVETNGSTQARSGAEVQAPSSLLSATKGWFAARVKMGWSSSSAPYDKAKVLSWSQDGSNFIVLQYESGTQWSFLRLGAATGVDLTKADSFSVGDYRTLVVAWDATTLYL